MVLSASSDRRQGTNARLIKTRSAPVRRKRPRRLSRPTVYALRLLVVVVLLMAWQFLPKIPWLSHRYRFLDPFFISSPVDVYRRSIDLLTGRHDSILVWPYLANTIEASIIGAALGIVLGMLVGLVLSSSPNLGEVFNPFLVLANSAPRIALVPIVVMLFGVGVRANVISSVLVVFFLAFFNAYTGGKSIPAPIIETSRLLGASSQQIMLQIRIRYVMQWTFAMVPNAVAFSLIVVVTTELLSGSKGMGSILLVATTNLDASLTFALVIVLTIVGLLMTGAAELLRRRILHWVVSDAR